MSVTVGADGSKMSTTDIGMAGNATITALAATATKVTTSSDAATALTTVKTAISTLAGFRADVGANMSRLRQKVLHYLFKKTTCLLPRVVSPMWMWLLKALTLHANRYWCNPALPCWLRLTFCPSRLSDSLDNKEQGCSRK